MDPSQAPTAVRSDLVARSEIVRRLHRLDVRTKFEPLCQFCVSWHRSSWSVLVEMAEMAETIDQAKT
jgi:hypothetical protein